MKAISASVPLPDKNIFVVLLLGLLGAELLIILASLSFPLEVLVVIAGAWVLYFNFKNTFVSLCTLILLHFFVLRGTAQITLPEIFFGLYFCAFLGIWFFRKIFLERQAILVDGLDYALVGFFGFCMFSIIPALLFGSSLFKWLRELIPYLTLLLVFPIREQADTPKRIKIILACFLLLCLMIAVDNLFSYKQAIARALQFWEIMASRQTSNAVLFMSIVIMAGVFFVMTPSRSARWASLFIMTVFMIALAVTFSRGFWLATMIGLAVAFCCFPGKSRWRMITYFGVSTLILTGLAFLFFGDLATFIINSLGQRMEPSAKPAKICRLPIGLSRRRLCWRKSRSIRLSAMVWAKPIPTTHFFPWKCLLHLFIIRCCSSGLKWAS
jgi:hypothetical protein